MPRVLICISVCLAGGHSGIKPRAVRSSACQDHSRLHNRLDVVEKVTVPLHYNTVPTSSPLFYSGSSVVWKRNRSFCQGILSISSNSYIFPVTIITENASQNTVTHTRVQALTLPYKESVANTSMVKETTGCQSIIHVGHKTKATRLLLSSKES